MGVDNSDLFFLSVCLERKLAPHFVFWIHRDMWDLYCGAVDSMGSWRSLYGPPEVTMMYVTDFSCF